MTIRLAGRVEEVGADPRRARELVGAALASAMRFYLTGQDRWAAGHVDLAYRLWVRYHAQPDLPSTRRLPPFGVILRGTVDNWARTLESREATRALGELLRSKFRTGEEEREEEP